MVLVLLCLRESWARSPPWAGWSARFPAGPGLCADFPPLEEEVSCSVTGSCGPPVGGEPEAPAGRAWAVE